MMMFLPGLYPKPNFCQQNEPFIVPTLNHSCKAPVLEAAGVKWNSIIK